MNSTATREEKKAVSTRQSVSGVWGKPSQPVPLVLEKGMDPCPRPSQTVKQGTFFVKTQSLSLGIKSNIRNCEEAENKAENAIIPL